MHRSTERILTTHVGSLIRPPALVTYLRAKQDGTPVDDNAFEACLEDAVAQVVQKQIAAGIDIINDGEFAKTQSWSRYILKRMKSTGQLSMQDSFYKSTMPILPATTTSSFHPERWRTIAHGRACA